MFEIRTLAGEIDAVLIRERLLARLSSLFGVLALLLACVGLYGLFAFNVVRRTREMAIRKAIVEAEENRTRLAYARQPDTEPVADDWSDVGKW